MATCIPTRKYLVVLEVVEEHRALQHWDLHGKVKGRIGHILEVEQTGQSRCITSIGKHVMALAGNVL